MTELEKFELVNSCETVENLKEVLDLISENGVIRGRKRDFTVEQQKEGIDHIMNGYPANLCTRSYGIRQQVLYLKYCRDRNV